jgi:hypothetical protein
LASQKSEIKRLFVLQQLRPATLVNGPNLVVFGETELQRENSGNRLILLARKIHESPDTKGLICYKHVVKAVFEAEKEAFV